MLGLWPVCDVIRVNEVGVIETFHDSMDTIYVSSQDVCVCVLQYRLCYQ
jgi:hypothetical protein